MFSHVMIGSNDIARSKKFYDALFTAIGGQPGAEGREGRLAYTHNGSRFMVTKPNDGKPASSANGGSIGFLVGEPQMGETWHKTRGAHGGAAIREAAGARRN